jgi:hypothetical protein
LLFQAVAIFENGKSMGKIHGDIFSTIQVTSVANWWLKACLDTPSVLQRFAAFAPLMAARHR